ncbi:hypothetical protein TIFTF001_016815 [Ficus carica]|uniref:Uncharacterized protein n=1 Tax=Ficus carica TaxID=3494 RepID=A0AA88A868_FICCA|nr:hypothetical protein TIFTF001_016815 [Ficus carica]
MEEIKTEEQLIGNKPPSKCRRRSLRRRHDKQPNSPFRQRLPTHPPILTSPPSLQRWRKLLLRPFKGGASSSSGHPDKSYG